MTAKDEGGEVKQVRNKKLLPDLRKEGVLTKEIILATKEKHQGSTGYRLFSHHTLASVRRMSYFHPFHIPDDSLDIVLAATYNHTTERFADKEDLYLQPETIGCDTWRRLRNTCDYHTPVVLDHPLYRGGLTERRSPFSVKLMNSGVHSSQTNPGYSRKPAGGAIFFY
ncbi:protein CFAP276 [Cydia splendana]|uniref:protein CFAP276 n=1 Tax=Cydia splendana TaxID=1100963 RepID=UPI0028F4AA61